MGRVLKRLLATASWALIGAVALIGAGISAVVVLSASPSGQRVLGEALTNGMANRISGRVAVEAVQVLPHFGLDLRGLRLYDPGGRVVLEVPHARLRLLTGFRQLAERELSVEVELTAPRLLLRTETGGGLSLAHALSPAHPAPTGGSPGIGFGLGLSQLTMRGGSFRWERADGSIGAEATAIDLDAEGAYSHAGGFLRLHLRAAAEAPLAGPIALVAAARLRGDRLEVSVQKASLGSTALEVLADGNIGTRAFRVAVLRLGLAATDARRLLPPSLLADEVSARGYAESDGALLTAALEVRRSGAVNSEGTGFAAVALPLAPTFGPLGFHVAFDAFDPSRLLAQAPAGRITLAARGVIAGSSFKGARGRLELEMAPSRLRRGEVGPISVEMRAGGGVVEVERLDAKMPGLAVRGRGRWHESGAIDGEVAVDVQDLGRLGRALADLTGVPLPPLGGRLLAHATLDGTTAAPVFAATLDAPLLRVGESVAEALTLSVDAVGSLAAPKARLVARAARAGFGDSGARRLELEASVVGPETALSLSGVLQDLGAEPLVLKGAARMAEDRRSAEVRVLSLHWPGAQIDLARPAIVTFAPPAVDRLELVDGAWQLVLSGGLGPAGTLDLRLVVAHLDLSRLPRVLASVGAGLRGELSLDARATGSTRAPRVAAHVTVSGGEMHGLSGLELAGDLRWDSATARLEAEVGLRRAAGGALDLAADLSLPLARRRYGDPLALTVEASGWPVAVLRRVAGVAAPVNGTLGAHLAATGTTAAPALTIDLALEEASVDGLGPISASASLECASGMAQLTAATRLAGAPLLDIAAQLPLDLAGLLEHPETAVSALAWAPLSGRIRIPELDLAAVTGTLGLPVGLSGKVSATVLLGGTLHGPRGRATMDVAGAAMGGYHDLAARLEATAEADRTMVVVQASVAGEEALRIEGALGAPLERLSDPAVLRAAPLAVEAVVPPLALALAAGPALPLAGTLSAKLDAQGTLARPEARLDLKGTGMAVEGWPLGDLAALVRCEAPTCTAEVSFRSATGGTLWAGVTGAASLGLDTLPTSLGETPATLRVTSEKLDLGFVPALTHGLVRRASGTVSVDLTASGPVAGLRPRGDIKLEGGRLDLPGFGDWSQIALEASLRERAIEVARLDASLGAGRLSGRLSVNDIGTPLARLDGRLVFRQLTLLRGGMELATLDLPVELRGTLSHELLDTTVTVGAGTIRLPKKAPHARQSLEGRPEITEEGSPGPDRTRVRSNRAEPDVKSKQRRPDLRCHILVPGKLFLKGEKPALDLELRGDSTWQLAEGALTAQGSVEAVRGTAEPIAGRLFTLERGRVTFPGGPPGDGQLDMVARYDNPAAVVTVTVSGSVSKPSLQFASTPSLDEATIAMLIATGRTEVNLGTNGTGSITAQEATTAMVGAALRSAFSGLVADKLPVDQISLDPSTLRAGKYLTEKLFVGYAYHFDAKPEKGENVNEARGEYQITPRWRFELRYGDAQAGDASLIWSRDY